MKRLMTAVGVAAFCAATACGANKAPAFANGSYIYRLCTPDTEAGCVEEMKAGFRLVSRMLDGDIRQITIVNGIVGDDHRGGWNWDGLWPYWNRATFRVGGSMGKLHDFMKAAHDEANTFVSFHVNLTDVNVGLADYPESLEFFRRLVATKSIYRRDWNPSAGKRDGNPYTMTEEQLLAERKASRSGTIEICSLVDYKRFWDSGLAKEMIDSFYAALPYAPPLLYLDVFNEAGGNFATGFPEGGSFETQQEGATNICAYLRSRGTGGATEGPRDYFLGEYGTYGWLHCLPGYATRDYSRIWGAPKIFDRLSYMHVVGNTGAFAVSPVASTASQVEKDILHFNTLVRGKPSPRVMPGAKTFNIAFRGGDNDEYNQIPGMPGGDGLRGDWIDVVNNFYLCSIQELYHIGKGNNRTDEYLKFGENHFNGVVVTDPDGKETVLQLTADMPDLPAGVDRTRAMLEWCRHWKYTAPKSGKYKIQLEGYYTGHRGGGSQVYVDGRRVYRNLETIFPGDDLATTTMTRLDCGAVELSAGEHTFDMDAGPLKATWDDGTESVWEELALNRGFTCRNGDVVFAYDYDRMWPDTWSGKKKIHFFSWNGTNREWTLPEEWRSMDRVLLFPLTPSGRGKPQVLAVKSGKVAPKLLKQVPYVLVPYSKDEAKKGVAVEKLPLLTDAVMAKCAAEGEQFKRKDN